VLHAALKVRARFSPARRCLTAVALVAVASVALAACGSSGGASTTTHGSSSGNGSKLIIATMSFPCSLNDFATSLCAGFNAGAKALPAGWHFQLKTGTDFADTNAYNNLIQTSAQLNPGGLIVFPNGPATQTPVLRQACASHIAIIVVDNPVNGLGSCESQYIAANNRRLGEQLGKWLVAHPPSSKEVGIVTFPLGQTQSNDDRVNGFKAAVQAAGFNVVAVVPTDLTLDKTRTAVTNMLTAHPKLGAIFSANDQMGYGTAQAVKAAGKNAQIKQLTIDGALDAVKRIPTGLAADAAQDPFFAGKQSILNMVKILQGKRLAATVFEPYQMVDQSNVQSYVSDGGLR
jgi:ABC-type sugar transport system substrate-binding protein